MRALFSYVWDAVRIICASLGLLRGAVGIVVGFLLFRFYDQFGAYLSEQGFRHLPSIRGAWVAAAFATLYLLWHVLRYAVALERDAKPILSLKILDPSECYETYVALGNRLLRLYHVEVANFSRTRTAKNVSVSLETYQKIGDKKLVDIRSRLKVANSDAEEAELKPRGRAAFELFGVEANGADTLGLAETREAQTFSILPVGSGNIAVVATADRVPPTNEHYTLYIDLTGSMTIKPQTVAGGNGT